MLLLLLRKEMLPHRALFLSVSQGRSLSLLSSSRSGTGRKKRKKRREREAEVGKGKKKTRFFRYLGDSASLSPSTLVLSLKFASLSPRRAHRKQPWPPPLPPGKRDYLQSAPLRKRERAKAPATRRRALNELASIGLSLIRDPLPRQRSPPGAQQAAAFFSSSFDLLKGNF